MNKDIRKCPVCGQDIEVVTGRRGRPQVYHPECKRYQSLLVYIEDLTSSINFTNDRRKAVRGELWRIANRLNRGGGSCQEKNRKS